MNLIKVLGPGSLECFATSLQKLANRGLSDVGIPSSWSGNGEHASEISVEL